MKNSVPSSTQSSSQELLIKGDLPKLNEMIGNARTHWSASAKEKEDYTEWVMMQCFRMKPITGPVTLRFLWFYSSKHDFDNIRVGVKHILDGIKGAGKIPDDNQQWVKGFRGTTSSRYQKIKRQF